MAKEYHVEVTLRPGESSDRLVKRFIKKCKNEKIVETYRERNVFEKKSVKNRKKKLRKKFLSRQADLRRQELEKKRIADM
jgi:ribosomal protein S21